MHILIALVICSLLGVFGYTIAVLYEKMCDSRLSVLARFSMGWSVMWLMIAPLFAFMFALQWAMLQVWIMIFDPITGLIVGGVALLGYGGKKIHLRRLKKKYAEEVTALVLNYRDDFEWDKVPFEVKLRLAQYRKLFYQLLEKYSGADFDSTKPTSFVPHEIVELFEDGERPVHFVPYFPRFFIALHEYRETLKEAEGALVLAGDGWKGWVYTHVIKFKSKVPTESFESKKSIQFDKDETERCIAQIEEFVRNVEYFLECACKELGARGSKVFRARIHERAKRLYNQACTIDMFISQMGHASSAEEQRGLVIKSLEQLCNNLLVDPESGLEIKVVPKGTQIFEGDAREALQKSLNKVDQEKKALEQARLDVRYAEEDLRRERQRYINMRAELEQRAARQIESHAAPLQLPHQTEQPSPFSQPLPVESVSTQPIPPVLFDSSTGIVSTPQGRGTGDDEDIGEHNGVEMQSVAS